MIKNVPLQQKSTIYSSRCFFDNSKNLYKTWTRNHSAAQRQRRFS